MEIIQDDAKKLVQVWLSRKESGDEALQNQLKPCMPSGSSKNIWWRYFTPGRRI